MACASKVSTLKNIKSGRNILHSKYNTSLSDYVKSIRITILCLKMKSASSLPLQLTRNRIPPSTLFRKLGALADGWIWIHISCLRQNGKNGMLQMTYLLLTLKRIYVLQTSRISDKILIYKAHVNQQQSLRYFTMNME